MTEEEKKAIEKFKLWVDGKTYLGIGNKEAKALLNLIEKLKKENEEKTTIILAGAEKVKSLEKKIEELKNQVIKRNNELIELDETSEKEFITKQEIKENYIPKDKIEEKLKEYQKLRVDEIETYRKYHCRPIEVILEELLEEG